MSSHDGPPFDSLGQHRRELDAHFETLKTVRAYLEIDERESRLVAGRMDELRADLIALANRVEALTRAIGVDAGEHSVRTGQSFYPSFCRVCGHSWESVDEPLACPECTGIGSDIVAGPLATVLAPSAAPSRERVNS